MTDTIYSRNPFTPSSMRQRVRTRDGAWIRVTRAGWLHTTDGRDLGVRVHPFIWSGLLGAAAHYDARDLGAVVAALGALYDRAEHPSESDFHHGIPDSFHRSMFRARAGLAKARREARERQAAA